MEDDILSLKISRKLPKIIFKSTLLFRTKCRICVDIQRHVKKEIRSDCKARPDNIRSYPLRHFRARKPPYSSESSDTLCRRERIRADNRRKT